MTTNGSTVSSASVNVVCDVVDYRLKEQEEKIKALDTKAGFVLGSASLLITGLAGLQKTVFDMSTYLAVKHLVFDYASKATIAGLTILAVVAYFALVVASYHAYKIREYLTLTRVDEFRDKHIDLPEDEAKRALIDTRVGIVISNNPIIERKALAAQWAVRFLGLEALVVALLAIFQVFLIVTNGL